MTSGDNIYVNTKFHNNQSKFYSNIKDITVTFWEAIVLVLLMRGIYDVLHLYGLRWHDI
jgi:hypothetical protein